MCVDEFPGEIFILSSAFHSISRHFIRSVYHAHEKHQTHGDLQMKQRKYEFSAEKTAKLKPNYCKYQIDANLAEYLASLMVILKYNRSNITSAEKYAKFRPNLSKKQIDANLADNLAIVTVNIEIIIGILPCYAF